MATSPLTAADWAQLEAYIDGTLAPPDCASVEARLAADAVYAEALAEQQLLVAGIRAHGRAALRQRLARLEAELQATVPPVAPAPPLPSVEQPRLHVSWAARWRPVAAAATVLLAVGLGTWVLLRHTSPQALADRYGVPDPGLPVLMDTKSSVQRPLLNQAMNAYKLGDAAVALRNWEQIPAGTVGRDTMLYYQGIFQLKLHHNQAAAAAMQQLQQLPTTAFRERADYYFALALWAQGRTGEARTAFERLAATPGHPFSDNARQALEQL